ncbi:PAS domain-containing protein, partial [Streptomyces hyaluromycini]
MDSPQEDREDFDVPTAVGPHELLDASSDAAAVLSAEGDVIGWTRGAETLLGRPAAAVLGRPAARLLAMR